MLVVDDERAVAEILADLLAEDGHDADVAGDGRDALERLGRSHYDLVMTDIRMPALDGRSLYHEVERRYPGLAGRFLFVSGDVLGPETQKFLAETGRPAISKPFRIEEIRAAIWRVGRARPSAAPARPRGSGTASPPAAGPAGAPPG